MENEQWPTNYQQSVSNNSEKPISQVNSLNNGDKKIPTTKIETPNSCVDDDTDDVKFFLLYTKQEDNTNNVISEKSRDTIQQILTQIKTLSQNEKYYLYLKLPTEITDIVDPFRQSINPLGSRSEISRTIVWIQTHLEEDQNISLPKKEVYGEYEQYCIKNSIKPLSQADFGKVMKQVFPMVRARRLGQRGNSKYCYSGLRRRVNLNCPSVSDLTDKPLSSESSTCFSSLTFAAWLIVKEWAQKQLNANFTTISSLAHYLVRHCKIDLETDAVNKITSSSEPLIKIEEPTTPTSSNPTTSKNHNKHRDLQIQLQKKIQQRNEGKERKRKMQPKSDSKPGVKKYRSHSVPASSVLSNDTIGLSTNNKITNITNGECTTTSSSGSSSNSVSPTQGRNICDKSEFLQLNTQALPDFKCFQKPVLNDSGYSTTGEDKSKQTVSVINNDKVAILKIQPTNQVINPESIQRKQYKAIQPKLQLCDNSVYNTSAQVVSPQKDTTVLIKKRSQQVDCVQGFKDKVNNSKCEVALNKTEVDDDFPLTRERLDSVSKVEKNAMDEYLGTNNSQHEEELSKYFHSTDNTDVAADIENKNKLSTLRQLLEQNGISEKKTNDCLPLSEQLSSYTNSNSTYSSVSPQDPSFVNTLQTLPNITNIVSNMRRRVSFDTHIPSEETVPPSPNARSKHFNFTPISPGSHSPNSGQSKCSSTSASPFVSPRNTPVPRIKTTNYQNSTLVVIQEPRKPAKIKNELELNMEISTEINMNSIPATPVSPMNTNNNNNNESKSMLQKLLNKNNKIQYRPEYSVTTVESSDSTHLFTDQRLNVVQNSLITINSSSDTIISEILKRDPEFSEIPEQQNENSKQFFNHLDNNACDTNNINTLNVDLSSSSHCPPVFGLHLINNNNSESNCIPDGTFTNHVQKFRNLTRSQSINVEATYNVNKFAPSKSVPTTPLSFCHNLELDPVDGKHYLNNSRSYPSTPLTTNETFVYQVNSTCLLNERTVDNMEFIPDLRISVDNVAEHCLPNKNFPINNEFGMIESTDSFMDENGILIQQGYNTDNTNN